MTETVELAIWKQQQDVVANSFNAMRNTQFLTDLTIVCDGKELPVHRALLCASSPYFKTMFKSGFKESMTGKLELPTIPLKTAEIILDFIYTGRIPNIVGDKKQLKCLLEGSHLLQLNLLFQYCLQQLTESLCPTYFLELWELAILYDDTDLQHDIPLYIVKNFFELSSSSEFVNMTISQLILVLRHPEIALWEADIILNGIVAWAKFKDRGCELGKLLQYIDIKQVSADVLRIYQKDPLIESSSLANSIICGEISERFADKCCEPKILCFEIGENGTNNLMTMYYVNKKTWSCPTPLPPELKLSLCTTTVTFNGMVYFFGGMLNDELSEDLPSAMVYKFSPTSNIAVRLNDLQASVSQAGAGVLDCCIYIVGGKLADESQTTVQRVNTLTATNEVLSPTNVAHCYPIMFTFQKFVYAVGSTTTAEGAVERYNPSADEWTIISKVPGDINLCSGGLIGRKLMIVPFSDRTMDSRIHVFDLIFGKWDIIYEEGGPCSVWDTFVTSTSSILTIGLDNLVHVYNIAEDNWEELQENEIECHLAVFLK